MIFRELYPFLDETSIFDFDSLLGPFVSLSFEDFLPCDLVKMADLITYFGFYLDLISLPVLRE